MNPITSHKPEILRRYHLIAFALMWCVGWLICLAQTTLPIIDTGLDLIVFVIVSLISIPIMLMLSGLRVAL